jgi:molybdate transport system regulatory protein
VKISARNIFEGKITALKPGAVNSEVELTTLSGDRIVAIVTNESARSLRLSVGSEASALVKASSVLVMIAGDGVKLSARNCLAGNIAKVTHGPVSAEVTITLASGGTVHATITHDSATAMGLKAGIAATAVIKASSVILAVGA